MGRSLDRWLAKVGGIRVLKLGEGDENRDQDKAFDLFKKELWKKLELDEKQLRSSMAKNQSNENIQSDDDDDDNTSEPLVFF